MKSSTGFVQVLILVLVLIVGVAGGAYYLGTQKGKVSPPLPSGLPTPIRDPTAGWDTFESGAYSYTIKYPHLNVEFRTNSKQETKDFHIGITAPGQEDAIYYSIEVAVQILPNSQGLTLEELGDRNFGLEFERGKPERLDWKEAVFNNLPAITANVVPVGDIGPMTVYIFKYRQNIFAVWKAVIDTNYEDTADQILSTFKFTN